MYKYIIQVVDKIKDFYQSCHVFGLPHPGEDVEYEEFVGNKDEVTTEFKKMTLQYFIVIKLY